MITISDPAFKTLFDEGDTFTIASELEGKIFRQLEQRRTLAFQHKNKNYFIKLHFGISWSEIIKNLSQLKMPILSARNEWLAIEHLQANGISTANGAVYYDETGWWPKRRSFIIMSAVENFIDIGSLFKLPLWHNMHYRQRYLLVSAIARLARTMHSCGVQHRDFYICHMLLPNTWLESTQKSLPSLTLIDLHRSLLNKSLTKRQLIKDLSGLYFSLLEDGQLNKKEIALFVREYTGVPFAKEMRLNNEFWRNVKQKAGKTFTRHYQRKADFQF